MLRWVCLALFEIVGWSLQTHLSEGIAKDGSNLSGVSAVCSWEDEKGRRGGGAVVADLPSLLTAVGGTPSQDGGELELLRTTTLDKVHLTFNQESGRLILLALRYSPPSLPRGD